MGTDFLVGSQSVTFGFEAPFKNNGNIKGGAFLIQDSLGLHRAMQNCLESDKSIFFEYWKHRDGEWVCLFLLLLTTLEDVNLLLSAGSY